MVMVSSVSAGDVLGSNIQIVQSSISPDPVKPGNDLTVKFDVINTGDEYSSGVSIDLETNSVFSFKDSDFNKVDFAICGGCSYDATYYFTVKSNVVSGIYPITYNVNYDNGKTTTQTINVKVEGVPDILIVEDNLNSKKLYPSEEFDLNFNLENLGTGIAKNIKVSSDFKSIIKVGNNVDFIEKLEINKKQGLVNSFRIDENLNPGLYQIPFTIEFEDESGNSYVKTYMVGVEILNKALINIQYLKLSDYQINLFKEVTITGMIENIGYGEASNVYVEVETDLTGFKKSFVGALNKDEDSPIQFKFKADSVGVHDIALNVFYVDDFGEHNFKEVVKVNVVKPTSQLYTVFGFIGLLLVFILVKFVFKSKKGSKN